MAYITSDGFDWISAVADLAERWDTAVTSSLTVITTANTAFAVGQGLGVAFASATVAALVKAFPGNETTIFGNIRVKRAGTLSTAYSWITFYDGTTAQCSLRFNEDGSIGLYSGAANGTLLGSLAPAGTAASATWDSWQFKILISPTVGTFELRKNGSTTATLALTGLNTRPGSNTYVNKVGIGSFSSGTIHLLDDFFLCGSSGAVPNDWPGDLRAITQAPNATAQAQFSQSPTATTWGQSTNTTPTSSNIINGIIFYLPFVAPYSGTVSQLTMSVAATLTAGKLNVALYDSTGTGGLPGALMSQSSEKTAPTAGTQVFTLATPQSVVEGTTYYLACWSNVSIASSLNVAATISRSAQTLAYSSTFPSTAAGGSLSNTSCPYLIADLGTLLQHSLVNDTTQDGDTSYIFSSTVAQEDLFSFASLASQGVTPASVTGVIPFAIAKKSDSGARTMSVRAKSGATDASVIADASMSLTYKFEGAWLGTDPATSAAWTTSAVDALQVGVKVDA